MALLIKSLIRNNSKLQVAIWAVELIFLFGGAISTIFMVKDAIFPIPCSFNVVFSSLHSITTSFRNWLSSTLYIGIVINFMVVLIAALSIYHPKNNIDKHSTEVVDEDNDDGGVLKDGFSPSSSPPPTRPPRDNEETSIIEAEKIELEATRLRKTITASVSLFESYLSSHIWKDNGDEKLIRNNDNSLLALFNASRSMEEANEVIKEIDSLDSLFAKITHEEANMEEGKALHLTDDGGDSMEAMWKAITEGTEKPLNNQLKKSEIFPIKAPMDSVQSIDSKGLLPSAAAAWRELRKSVTFNDAISMRKRGGLMRETSMSLDNLNRRVETFINKFNNAMRIERQESEQRLFDKVNRG